jgi:hypothetical protein
MCAEASTVLRAVAADFFFNCWYLEISWDNRIRHIPRCFHNEGRWFDSLRDQRIFSWPNPSIRTMALGSTQPLAEMSTRSIPREWRVAGRRVRVTVTPPSMSQLSRTCGNLDGSQIYVPPRPHTRLALPFYFYCNIEFTSYLIDIHRYTSHSINVNSVQFNQFHCAACHVST